MSNKQKLSVIVLVILILGIVLTACGGGSNDAGKSNSSAQRPSDDGGKQAAEVPQFGESPFEFSFYRHYDFASPFGYGTDVSTQWLQKEKQLNIIEISSNGNAKQKFGTMIASKDFPDAIQMDRGSSDYRMLVENELLVPLDEYYEKYPNLRELIDEQTFNMLKHEDGHIYVIPNWFDSERNPFKYVNTGWTVNTKIYRELGEPELNTLDDLYAYLQKVKEKYPQVVPVESGIVMNGVNMLFKLIYTAHGDNRTIWNIGDVPMLPNYSTTEFEPIFDDPAYKETFKFMNKLYREGLVTQDMFTQKEEQVLEKLNSGRIAVTGTSNITGYGQRANNILQAKDPDSGYDYIPFLAAEGVNRDTVNPFVFGTLGWNVNVITTAAKEPERVFQFFDYWAGMEGQRILLYGPPGILYDEVDENGAPIDNEKAATITAEERANLQLGLFNPLGTWYYYTIGHYKNAQNPDNNIWDTEASEYFGQFAKINSDQFTNMSLDPQSDIGIKHEQIKQFWFEYDAKLMFAKSDQEFEALYKELEAGVNQLGYAEVLAEKTKTWEKNLELMK